MIPDSTAAQRDSMRTPTARADEAELPPPSVGVTTLVRKRFDGPHVNFGGANVRRRAMLIGVAFVVAIAVLSTIALTVGEVEMSAGTALRAALGIGDAGEVYIVQEFRAPRLVAGLLAGAGLATAGAVLKEHRAC